MTSKLPHASERIEALYARSLDCVHCGLCLSTCPTYRVTGRETSSPRGRIYMLRGVAEGKIPLSGVVADEAYLCLACRACETACPSGVRFGSLIELARAEVEATGVRNGASKRLEKLALRGLVPHRRRLHWAMNLLAAVQRTRLDRWLARALPAALRSAHGLLPRVPPRADRRLPPEFVPAQGERRGRVGFLIGCVMPEFFGSVNAATIRVLAKNGFDVVIPRDQGCCGALQAHAGDVDSARVLARQNIAAFAAAKVDALVVNSAGCSAAMRDTGEWLPEEGEGYAASIRDVAEFLDAEGLRAPTGRIDATVCYDDPCHLAHAQGVVAAPRRLLEQIPGVTLAEHADPAACCGAAGIYNLTHPEMSRAVLDRKLDALAAVDPDIVATGNPGCLMQLSAGLAARGLRGRVLHPVVMLDEAYR
jgi:glycolate oxidase iron-sulfur subunit